MISPVKLKYILIRTDRWMVSVEGVDLDVEVVRLSVVHRNQEHVTRSCLLFELKKWEDFIMFQTLLQIQ